MRRATSKNDVGCSINDYHDAKPARVNFALPQFWLSVALAFALSAEVTYLLVKLVGAS